MTRSVFAALSAIMLTLVLAGPGRAGDVLVRKVTGSVVATETAATPNTIVVRTVNWKGQELIIGAAVENDTVIKIGSASASLKDLRSGDRVEIVYERNKRVVAKSIKTLNR